MQSLPPWMRRIAFLPVLVVAVGSGGCGKGSVYPVQGKVTFLGKALPGGGSIAFIPLGDQQGKTAGGVIAEDGTYQLSTYQPGDGSMTGEFRVVITQVIEKEPENVGDGQRRAQSTFVVAKEDRIPAIYSDVEKSPLKATVEAKSPNEISFDLKRQP